MTKKRGYTITGVSFGRTVNTGNYTSARFELYADVSDGDWRAALADLQRKAAGIEKRLEHKLAIDEDL